MRMVGPWHRSGARWVVAGGLAAGALDLALACTFWGLRGVAPGRIAQSIAAGLLGERAFELGTASALLGVLLHFLIAIAFVLAYRLALARVPALDRHRWRNGLSYGAALFLVMNFVVLPLSAAAPPAFQHRDWLAASIMVHLAIGVMSAWFAGASFNARRRAPSAR